MAATIARSRPNDIDRVVSTFPQASEQVDSAIQQASTPIVVHAKSNSLKRTFLSSFPDECILNETRDEDNDEDSLESLSVYSGEVMDFEDNEDEDESMEISDSDESESDASVHVVSRAKGREKKGITSKNSTECQKKGVSENKILKCKLKFNFLNVIIF